MKNIITVCYCCLLLIINKLTAQQPFVTLPEQLNHPGYAEWITCPGITGNEYGVYYFRKSIELNDIPEKYIVHVSADNRYRLYVNGQMISWGPAVGDLNNWFYETVDIAGKLHKGENIIAAQVWNMGKYKGMRQVSNQTAFILQGNSNTEQPLNTNASWKVIKDKGYHPLSHNHKSVGGGYIAGGTDSLVAELHPWNWNEPGINDQQWAKAIELGKGNHSGLNTWYGTPWLLKKRQLPPMEMKAEKTPTVLYSKGIKKNNTVLTNDFSFTIAPNSSATLLLDNKQLTMGFPHLNVSGGKQANIKIYYQEALFNDDNTKGNRNEWKNKHMKGYYDVFTCDGGDNRKFVPLWIRVFRYVKIEIETHDAPLKVNSFYNVFTAYPLQQKATFTSDADNIERIWEVSWRTARLCALENYMDCPYYEQLQYIGDARIQALISMYVAGDNRLARNAIDQFNNSLQPMGLTKSSHPNAGTQIIPPFSLIYISMLHDYFMLNNDSLFLSQYLPGVSFILNWFIARIDNTDMLGPLTYWNHVDGGAEQFKAGSPPGIETGGSAHMAILLAHTLKHAAAMFEHMNNQCEATQYRQLSEKLISATLKNCYDPDKRLIAETPNKKTFSQHTNAIAILADAFDTQQQQEVAQLLIKDTTLIEATLYFNFYIFQALNKAGMGEAIFQQLKKWDDFIDFGFTTFPEHGLESRSDCHAWSAHPMYDLLNITCGIAPAAPGFTKVQIAPQPGKLKYIKCSMPHPAGIIETDFKIPDSNSITGVIKLPRNVTGTLLWNHKKYPLHGGINNIKTQ